MKKPKVEFNTWVRWYVLGNQSEVAIYRSTRDVKFKFIERMTNEEGRNKERDMDSDGPGKGISSAGNGTIHHSLDRSFHHHENYAKQFSRTVAKYLDHAAASETYNDLILVCEPHFLGLLRTDLSDRVKKLISHEVNREYNYGSDQEIHSLILRAMEEMPHVHRS